MTEEVRSPAPETQLDPNSVSVAAAPTAPGPTPRGREVGGLLSNVRLHGEINDGLRFAFYQQIEAVPLNDNVVLELFTRGGDADIGRLIACELKLLQEYQNREILFKGRSTIYSAGVTIMSAVPKNNRFLSREASIMIHGRQLERTVQLTGSIRSSLPEVKSLLAQMETALAIEKEDFRDLAEGSTLSGEDIWERAEHNWYLTAQEALDLGLVEGLF